MSTVQLTKNSQQVWGKDQGFGTLANLDVSNPVYIEYGTKGPTLQSDQIPPYGSITVDGSDSIQANAPGPNGAAVQVMPSVVEWTPSPLQNPTPTPLLNNHAFAMVGSGSTSSKVMNILTDSVYINMQGGVNVATVSVEFFTDATGATIVDDGFALTAGGAEIKVTLPVLSPWMQLVFQNRNSGANTITTTVIPMNKKAVRPEYTADQNFINLSAISVPASTTNTYPLPSVQPGEASYYFDPADATSNLVFTIDPVPLIPGVSAHFLRKVPAAEVDGSLYLPDIPLELKVQNLDGAGAHVFTASLTLVGGMS